MKIIKYTPTSFHKLAQSGITHLLVPAFFIVAVGGIGVYVLALSHAATGDTITSGIAGKCLDDWQSSSTNGNKADLYTCNKTGAQQWTETASHQLKNNNGACLDNWQAKNANRNPIKMYSCSTSTTKVDPAEVWEAYEGGFRNPATGKCLNDPGSSTTNGTELILYTCVSSEPKNQVWTVTVPSTISGNPQPTVPTTPTTPTPPTTPTTPTGGGGSTTSSAGTSPKPVGVSGNWTIKFDDEFSGTSLGSDWNAEGPRLPNNSQEYDCYSPNNVSVSGGYLNMALTDTACTVSGKSFQYTGSQIDTDGHFNPTYGYFEARVDAPGSNGKIWNWPAWWMFGPNWPAGGEIDTFEGLGGYAGWHFDHADSSGNSVWQGGVQTGDDYTGWHVYGVDWQPNSITYYYDGVKVGTITSGVTNQPMRLVIDNTTSPVGNQAGPIVVPATLKVDYVRAWQ